MFLTFQSLDLTLKEEIIVTSIWVRLPYLALILCDEGTFQTIGDKLGRYINRAKPKGNMYFHARIFLEVDFEKGLLDALQNKYGRLEPSTRIRL
jgi:hypothetical protein